VFSVISTDTDSNVVTSVGQSTQQNSLTTGFISGSITVYAKASTPIQYSLAYASSGATAMQYELRVVVAGTTAPSSTGTVSSFNGRTGAVTPGSSDYTAAQVGALASTSLVAAKNGVINGGMDIWQRGTSFTLTGGGNFYTADRWFTGATNLTIAQESSTVPTGYKYSMKVTTSATQQWFVDQFIETSNSLPFAGQTVTFSALVSASTSTNISLGVGYSTTVDASNSSSLTSATLVSGGSGTASSGSFTQITGTFTIPSTAKTIAVYFFPTTTATSGTSVYVTGVQLEIGSTATAFSRAGGTIQGELAACQRYFWTNNTAGDFFGQAWSTTAAFVVARLPATMRTTPSFTVTSLTNNINEPGIAGGFTPTGSWVGLNLSPYSAAIYNSNFSGLTSLYPVQWGNGYVQLSAEL